MPGQITAAGDCKLIRSDGSVELIRPYSISALKSIQSKVGRIKRGTLVALFRRDKGHCRYCYASLSPGEWEPHFVKPISLGGLNRMTNLVVSCNACHQSRKGSVREPRPVFGQR